MSIIKFLTLIIIILMAVAGLHAANLEDTAVGNNSDNTSKTNYIGATTLFICFYTTGWPTANISDLNFT
jgi:amino acid transporter